VGTPHAPLVMQAPELLGVNAPSEEGVTDVLKTVRSFFGVYVAVYCVCCSVLQCVAVCCGVLRCVVAVRCAQILQRRRFHGRAQDCVKLLGCVCCSVLQRVAACGSVTDVLKTVRSFFWCVYMQIHIYT